MRAIMNRLWVVVAVTLRLTLAPCPAADFNDLERVAAEELKATGIPGAAVAVVQGDRVVFARGFGVCSAEGGSPVTADTLFRLGSTTKMFTAVAVVQLVEEGKLKLDEPVGKHVKGSKEPFAALTPHQLLTHTAGITDEAPWFGLHDDTALGQKVRSWGPDFRFTEPGRVYSYSNPGYWLAGLVVEEVSGRPFADRLAESLFGPLGMRRTTFRPTLAMTYPLAVGHALEGGKATVIRPLADNAATWPAGSIFSSANDLSRFAVAFLNAGQLDGKPVLSPSLIQALSSPHVPIPGGPDHYGYGLHIGTHRGLHVLEHGGSRSGYGSQVMMVPDRKVAVIVLANSTAARLPKTLDAALESVLPLGPPARPGRSEVALTAEEVARWAGVYGNNRERVELVRKGDGLALKGGRVEGPVVKVGNDRYRAGGGEFVLLAGPDGAGVPVPRRPGAGPAGGEVSGRCSPSSRCRSTTSRTGRSASCWRTRTTCATCSPPPCRTWPRLLTATASNGSTGRSCCPTGAAGRPTCCTASRSARPRAPSMCWCACCWSTRARPTRACRCGCCSTPPSTGSASGRRGRTAPPRGCRCG
jgi:CubicO group peptidase (beta-lactamase class C family)